ncbi:hypothetical protein ACOSQ2_024413 [Xanthoceras sorbifolium]
MGGRRYRVPSRPDLSAKRKGEIAVLAAANIREGNILTPTKMKKAGLADFLALSGNAVKQASLSLKRKLDDLDDNEECVDETMSAMALHSGQRIDAAPSGMKSAEASPSSKGLSSAARSRQTRSGKGKTSILTSDDMIEPVRTLAEFAAKSVL